MALMDYLKQEIKPEEISGSKENPVITPVASQSVPQDIVNNAISQKPEWMSDEDYKEATLYYSPDRINQLYKNFDPKSSTPFYQDLYKSTMHKPLVPDERRIKAANSIAGVTDALSLLTQGITGFAGGNIPKQESSALRYNESYLQRLRDIYKLDRDRYNAGLYQSTLHDTESARQGYDRDRSGLLGVIQNSRKFKNARDIAGAKNALEQQKWRSQEGRLADDSKERARHNQFMESIASKNAAANMTRANKTGTGSGSRSLKNGDLEFFDANTASTYTVNEKKFKANAPQMFKLLKEEIFADDENLKRRYNSSKGKLSLQEQEDAVKKYMYDNPEAMKFLGKISKDVDQDKSLKEETVNADTNSFGLNNDQLGTIENFIGRSEGDDKSAIRDIASYLKSEGFGKDDIINIIRKLQE